MTVSDLNNYIKHYIEKDKTQMAIMLTGVWGSGKSYYIKNELVPYLQNEINITCIVVSLYGIDSLSDISKNIYMELRLPNFSKNTEGMATGRLITKSVIKNIVGVVGLSIDIPDEDLKNLYKSVDLTDKLLILEDLERSNIDISQILGFVNSLVEHDGIKVLIVANEDEIINRNQQEISFRSVKEGKENESTDALSDYIKQYIRIKEKTVIDTLYFGVPLNNAIKNIISSFNNSILNTIVNEECIDSITSIVKSNFNNNLRTFIYATQKTVDIYEKISDVDSYEEGFFAYIYVGVMGLASKIKKNKFPKWDGTTFFSFKLGTNKIPLFRFAYDYVRWQKIDINQIDDTYEAFNKYIFYEKNAEYDDTDMRLLSNFTEETEKNVYNALKNLEEKLQDPVCIGFYAYDKLIYYMFYVGNIVGFDNKKSCDLILKNLKGLAKRDDISSDELLRHDYDIEDSEIKHKYDQFIKELSDAINYGEEDNVFLYNPEELEQLYNDICLNDGKYIAGHQFISKYDSSKLIEMLLKCTAEQINDFRGILLAVYRYANKGDFIEQDIETMQTLLQLAENANNSDNNWDKIQQLQINYLCSNLKNFINKLS